MCLRKLGKLTVLLLRNLIWLPVELKKEKWETVVYFFSYMLCFVLFGLSAPSLLSFNESEAARRKTIQNM